MLNEDETIRATVRNSLAKARLRDDTNETIHNDEDSAIRDEKSETIRDRKNDPMHNLRNGRQARVIAPL